MAYTEKNMQTAVNKWLRSYWQRGSAAFELKICKKQSLAFSRVLAHQLDGLLNAKHHTIVKKLSDLDPSLKPFDSFLLTKTEAYVTVLYYQPRKQKEVYFIDIDDFLEECANCKRKSLTQKRAKEISTVIARI